MVINTLNRKKSLEIRFERNNPAPGASLIDHVIIHDGCEFVLDENNTTPLQRASIIAEEDIGRRKYLLKMCTYAVDHVFSVYREINLHCPACKKDYTITKKQYEKAYSRFKKKFS